MESEKSGMILEVRKHIQLQEGLKRNCGKHSILSFAAPNTMFAYIFTQCLPNRDTTFYPKVCLDYSTMSQLVMYVPSKTSSQGWAFSVLLLYM